jgi:hypothetical protein
MAYCGRCGEKINGGRFCPRCGTPVNEFVLNVPKTAPGRTINNTYHNMTNMSGAAIISSKKDVSKVFFNYLILGGISVILGIIFIWLGVYFIDQVSYFSSDFERYMPFLIMGMGGMGILAGVPLPFLKVYLEKSYYLNVFHDHIEGRGTSFAQAGNVGQVINFYEPTANISSVSTAGNAVVINLKDGRKIKCSADNADEIAHVMRVESLQR